MDAKERADFVKLLPSIVANNPILLCEIAKLVAKAGPSEAIEASKAALEAAQKAKTKPDIKSRLGPQPVVGQLEIKRRDDRPASQSGERHRRSTRYFESSKATAAKQHKKDDKRRADDRSDRRSAHRHEQSPKASSTHQSRKSSPQPSMSRQEPPCSADNASEFRCGDQGAQEFSPGRRKDNQIPVKSSVKSTVQPVVHRQVYLDDVPDLSEPSSINQSRDSARPTASSTFWAEHVHLDVYDVRVLVSNDRTLERHVRRPLVLPGQNTFVRMGPLTAMEAASGEITVPLHTFNTEFLEMRPILFYADRILHALERYTADSMLSTAYHALGTLDTNNQTHGNLRQRNDASHQVVLLRVRNAFVLAVISKTESEMPALRFICSEADIAEGVILNACLGPILTELLITAFSGVPVSFIVGANQRINQLYCLFQQAHGLLGSTGQTLPTTWNEQRQEFHRLSDIDHVGWPQLEDLTWDGGLVEEETSLEAYAAAP